MTPSCGQIRMSEKTLYIVDAHAHIYASYYAIRALSSPAGEPTNAVFGFTATLLALLRDRKPDGLVVVFDPPGGSAERNKIYPEYKANREKMPEDLPGQIGRIHQVLAALGVAEAIMPGFEADDVIASLARKAHAAGRRVFICSRDKDLEQLIDKNTRLFDVKTAREIDGAALAADKGYRPEQAGDILALTGDTADNVPGVPGIGPKTAAKLLADFNSLDNLLANLDKLKPNLAEKLRQHRSDIDLARKLVRLREDLDVPINLETIGAARPDPAKWTPLFTELGFHRFQDAIAALSGPTDKLGGTGSLPTRGSTGRQAARATQKMDSQGLLADLNKDAGPVAKAETMSAEDCRYLCVDTEEALDKLAADLAGQGEFAFDTETTGLDFLRCELVGMSFSWQDRVGYYVPVRGVKGQGVGLTREQIKNKLGPVLADPKIAKVGQNIKFDLQVVRTNGMELAGANFDTMIASHLLDPERGDHSMDSLALAELGHKSIPITDLIGRGRDQISMRDVPLDRISVYAAEDADVTWRVYGKLKPRLAPFKLDTLLADVEMPLLYVLAAMERKGVALDVKLLAAMSEQMEGQLAELEEKIYKAADCKFNIDSTRQLADVLFNKLHLDHGKKTRGGSASTDVEVLESLAGRHEVPRLVLEYRQITKLKGTYVDALPAMINPDTGRVHPTFTQTRAATGRLACQDPNLQNIPIRTAIGRTIRQAFVPSAPGLVMLTADYSQIELRMLAHFSKDPALMAAFAEDQDIHTFVASQVFDVMPQMVDPEQRRRAKAVNFGIIYGQTPFGLAKALDIPQSEAKAFIDAYFKRYGTIRKFLELCCEQARTTGCATTILGRRRPIPDIHSANQTQRGVAERTAVNTVTQGSAADLIKLAMINIHRRIETENRPIRMLIQVHDELVFEVPEPAVEEQAEMIRHEMCTALKLDVPLKVDVAWGPSWLEAK